MSKVRNVLEKNNRKKYVSTLLESAQIQERLKVWLLYHMQGQAYCIGSDCKVKSYQGINCKT